MSEELMRRQQRQADDLSRRALRKRLVEAPAVDVPASLVPVVPGETVHMVEDGAGDRLVLGPVLGPPRFQVRRTTSLSIAGSTYQKVAYNVVDEDSHDAWDATNGVFVAPVAGTYHFDAGGLVQLANNPQYWVLFLEVNGTRVRRCNDRTIRNGTGGDVHGIAGSADLRLAAGDEVHVSIFNLGGNATGIYLDGEEGGNYFNGHLVA